MILWLTGLSGSGKTTIARAIACMVKPKMPELVLIDGDVIRALYGGDLGYSENDRSVQIQRIQKISLFLADQGMAVIVSALYASDDLLRWNRENLPGYYEVLVSASMPELIRRDTKGFYKKALSGRLKNFVGIDIPWNEPKNPDLRVNTEGDVTPKDIALQIMSRIPRFSPEW